MKEMLSVEEARDLVLSQVTSLETELVPLLDAVGRVAAADLVSDIDVAPFANSAMDGFALRAQQIAEASEALPVELDVVAEVAAGDVYEGNIAEGQCIRIMTGACLPKAADSVVKYEIVDLVAGDGRPGSRVSFSVPTLVGSHVRAAGEEAKAGEVVVSAGEVINSAGVGFLAGCGIVEVPTYRRPRVAIISIGSELVMPTEVPAPGKVRNSNSFALAACAKAAGALPEIMPIAHDSIEELSAAISAAVIDHDFVVTSGGASNGDFDFIKPVISSLGVLHMTSVNMRPGKAQTFGIVNNTPVFGLAGNPAASYCGFELLVRPALRKMQGYTSLVRTCVKARLATDVKKKDPRRIFLRSTIARDGDNYVVTPAKNQGSALFSVIQRSNCLAIMPEGRGSKAAGDVLDCLLLDVSEDLVL